jgi:transposase-like protein
MAETRRKFDQDFKEGAVRLVRETGRPIAQVARDLGINEGTLGNWVNADKRRRGDGNELGEDERAELARLRKENAELAMERDVLKRSVALRLREGQGRDGEVAVAALVAAQREQHRVPQAVACRALGVSRSWYYKHKDRPLTPRAARRQALAAEVRRLFGAHRGTYGSPRITADLRELGWTVSENTSRR